MAKHFGNQNSVSDEAWARALGSQVRDSAWDLPLGSRIRLMPYNRAMGDDGSDDSSYDPTADTSGACSQYITSTWSGCTNPPALQTNID